MKIKQALCIVGLFISTQTFAQEYLYLIKKGSTKTLRLETHHKISVRLQGSDAWEKGEITSLFPDRLELDHMLDFYYDTIAEIKITKQTQKSIGNGFRKAALLYTGILLINGAIVGSSPLVPKNHAIAAGSMYAFGWLLHLTSTRKYALQDWRIEYINLDFLE